MEHVIAAALGRFVDDWHFSHVVRHAGLLLLSGVTGTDESGLVDPEQTRQFEQAFEHLRTYLEAADACFADVLEITSYRVGLRRHLSAFTAVKDRYLLKPYPAWSAIGVSELIAEGALVEIRAVARDRRAS